MIQSHLRTALTGALLAVSLAAQTYVSTGGNAAQRTVLKPRLPFTFDASCMHDDNVTVKFAEGVRVRLGEAGLFSLEDVDLGAVRAVLGAASVQRLFSRSVEELDREREELQRNVPAGQPPLADLNNYYRVAAAGGADVERLVNQLNQIAVVETAFPQHKVVPLGDIPPVTPQFGGGQTYFGAPPAGYDYTKNWSIVGARFQTGQMAQLEGSWHFGHEDQDDLVLANVIGTPPGPGFNIPTWQDHGTACVGIMCALRNGFGVRGFGSGTRKLWVSSLESGAANMINMTAARLAAGDVMSSSFAWVVGGNHAPVDFQQDTFDAIRNNVTPRGIFYTFGSGNTSQDLGNAGIYGGRYAVGATSSGGFIIGATDGGNLVRAGFSNFGQRIDANGWGSEVTTMGYGDLFNPGGDVRQHYTSGFGGTSAAGPAVAGCIATYVGAVKEQNNVQLTPAQVTADLRSTGTAIPGGNIGTRPNLTQLLALRGLPDGLLTTQHARVTGGPLPFVLQAQGPVGTPYAIFISAARAAVASPWNRRLLIDFGAAFNLVNGFVGAGGFTNHTVGMPNDASLRNLVIYSQAGQIRAGNIYLTNSTDIWVE
jgi:hypothetical protein